MVDHENTAVVYLSRDQNFPVGRFARRSLAYSRFNTASVTGKVADISVVPGAQVVPEGFPASVERKVTLMGIVQRQHPVERHGPSGGRSECDLEIPVLGSNQFPNRYDQHDQCRRRLAGCRVMNVATEAGGGNITIATTTTMNNPRNQVCKGIRPPRARSVERGWQLHFIRTGEHY
jgi:hypothetical protein